MEKYTPKETEFVGEIKRQFREFIRQTQSLNEDAKKDLLVELNSNWFDERFDGKMFIESAIEQSQRNWQIERRGEMDLWKQIAVQNASVSNEPHKVADRVLKAYKSSFFFD